MMNQRNELVLTDDGYEPIINHYYYLSNGQCVVLDDFATRTDGTTVFIVIPQYEGTAMSANCDGGVHHEVTADYIHEGLPELVTSIFKKAPIEKLCMIYKAKMQEIESLALSIGTIQATQRKLEVEGKNLKFNTAKLEREYITILAQVNEAKKGLDKINELANQRKQQVREAEDIILSMKLGGDTVVISKKELIRLNRQDYMVECLINAGVDNWDFYEDALKEYLCKYPAKNVNSLE